MKVFLTSPRGYCDGVINAINLAKKIRLKHPQENVSILGMLVHNADVIEELSALGIKTIYNNSQTLEQLLDEVPPGIVIFTAHGHDKQLEKKAQNKGLIIYDATCQYVQKSYDLISQALQENHDVIYLGKKGHPETIACLSLSRHMHLIENLRDIEHLQINDPTPHIFNQTTLSIFDIEDLYSALEKKYPHCVINNEICKATTLRQMALLSIPPETELIYVVGGANSANTQKLLEICQKKFPQCIVKKITGPKEIEPCDLVNINYAAIASGASTPKETSEAVRDYLNNFR